MSSDNSSFWYGAYIVILNESRLTKKKQSNIFLDTETTAVSICSWEVPHNKTTNDSHPTQRLDFWMGAFQLFSSISLTHTHTELLLLSCMKLYIFFSIDERRNRHKGVVPTIVTELKYHSSSISITQTTIWNNLNFLCIDKNR